MSKKNNNKAHGSTPASLYGKTQAPIKGEVIKVMHKPVPDGKFDRSITARIYKVLIKTKAGLIQAWFNTYQTGDSPEYVGEKTDLAANQSPITAEEFDTRCSEGGYVAYEGAMPPQLEGAPVAAK